MASFRRTNPTDPRLLAVGCTLLLLAACAPGGKAGADGNNLGSGDAGSPIDAGLPIDAGPRDAGPPPPAALAITVQPTAAVAGATITPSVQVTVEDSSGRPVATATNAITIALAPGGPAGTLAGTVTADAVGGVATFAGLSIRTAGVGYALVATSAGLTAATSQPFDISVGPASSTTSTLSILPATVQITGTSSAALTVTVLDATGNPISGQTVSLGASGTANVFTPSSGQTNTSGLFTATLSSTVAQAEVVTATVGAFSLTAPVTFSAGVPSAQTTTFSVNPGSVVADGATASTLTVAVLDENHNPISGQQVQLSAETAAPANSVVFAQVTGATGMDGVYSTTVTSQVAQSATLKATVGSLTLQQPLLFVAGAPSPTRSTFAVTPASVTANGTAAFTLTVTVVDAFGNPIDGQQIGLSAGNAPVSLATTGGMTGADGTYVTTVTSTTAHTATLTATIGTFSLTQPVTFVAGTPSQVRSTFSVTPPGGVTADGVATAMLTITVLDAFSNPVDGQLVSLSPGSAPIQIAMASGMTNASGVFTTTATSTVAQTATLSATIGTFLLSQPVTFNAGVAIAGQSTLTLTGSPLVADGVTAATVVVTAIDAHANPVPGASVGLTATGATVSVAPASPQLTGAMGTATFTLTSLAVGMATLSATVAGATLAQTPVLTLVGAALPLVAAPVTLSTSSCTTGYSNSSPKIAIDGAHVLYVLMNCGGTAKVATSTTGGVTFSAPVSTGITGAALPDDMAIVGGGVAQAYVVAYTSTNAIAYSMTSDGGVTWSTPATIGGTAVKSGGAYGLATVAASGSNVYVGYLSSTGPQIYGNRLAGVGAFSALAPSPLAANHTEWWRLLVDSASGALITASEDGSLYLAASTDGGNSWGPQLSVPGVTGAFSSWAIGGGTVFNAGFETSAWSFPVSGTSGILAATSTVSATTIAGVIKGGAQSTSVAADAVGNAYIATTPLAAVTVQTIAAGSATVTTKGVVAKGGSYPAVFPAPDGSGPLVVAWFSSGVQVAVVTPTVSTMSFDSTDVTWGTPSNLTVTANSLTGAPLSGQAVTLSASDASVILGATSGTTGEDGTWSTTVTGAIPGGTPTITATVDGLPIGTAVVTVGTPPAVTTLVDPVEVDGAMTGCTTAASNTSQKIAVDAGGNIYMLMNCSGTGYVAVSTNGGTGYSTPVSTGISGVTLGTNELQIVAGASGKASVVGYTSANTVLFTTTANDGGSWSSPVTVGGAAVASATGYGLANVALNESSGTVFVSYLTASGPVLYSSGDSTTFTPSGSPPLTDAASGDWRLFYDPATELLFDVSEDSTLSAATSQGGATWSSVLEFAGQTSSKSSWAAGGGVLYNAGSAANVYRISTSLLAQVTASPAATVISGGIPGDANETAVAADSSGNGYLAATANGFLTVQRVPAAATVMNAPALIPTETTTPYASIAALPGGGQVVSYTDNGVVYATVVTAP